MGFTPERELKVCFRGNVKFVKLGCGVLLTCGFIGVCVKSGHFPSAFRILYVNLQKNNQNQLIFLVLSLKISVHSNNIN